MARKYECMLIFNPDIDEELLKKDITDFEALIAKNGGAVVSKSEPKRIDIGYTIKKKKTGNMILYVVTLSPEKVDGITKTLNIKDALLRFSIIAQEEKKVSL